MTGARDSFGQITETLSDTAVSLIWFRGSFWKTSQSLGKRDYLLTTGKQTPRRGSCGARFRLQRSSATVYTFTRTAMPRVQCLTFGE